FEAVHDFLIPSRLSDLEGRSDPAGSGPADPAPTAGPSGAIFHAGVPAWAVQPDGTVIGTLWRNARVERCDFYGAQGTDPDAHTADYAWRVAGGISGPEQGRQLREALAYQTPLQAVAGTPAGTLPREFSLATTSPDAAIITAAKAASTDAE